MNCPYGTLSLSTITKPCAATDPLRLRPSGATLRTNGGIPVHPERSGAESKGHA